MIISIGSNIIEGPWGGGNQFVLNLVNFLTERGHVVINDLCEPNIDIILLTDPRSKRKSSSSFNHKEVKKYKKYINNNVTIIQRINECDERKDTIGVNQFYLKASQVADKVVFVSSWLKDIYVNLGLNKNKAEVILAGANKMIFNPEGSAIWNKKDKLKIVTHHWSSHENKGFKDYLYVDKLLNQPKWKNIIEFTYIGNVNDEYKFKNTKIIKPISGYELSKELKNHHAYLTGSINEPSGNHHIEAAQCGLPIIYKISGGMPEYCNGYGVGYFDNLEKAIQDLIESYTTIRKRVLNYSNNSDQMCSKFLDLFIQTKFYSEKLNQNKFLYISKQYLKYIKFKKKLVSFFLKFEIIIVERLKKILGKKF